MHAYDGLSTQAASSRMFQVAAGPAAAAWQTDSLQMKGPQEAGSRRSLRQQRGQCDHGHSNDGMHVLRKYDEDHSAIAHATRWEQLHRAKCHTEVASWQMM